MQRPDDPMPRPDKLGMARAWALDLDAIRKAQPGHADATVGGWIIEAPWAHPFWHSYALFMIHLREVERVSPPVIRLEGATHELQLWALDPAKPRAPYLNGKLAIPLLQPANFIAQLIAEDDKAALERVERAVDMIVLGALNPDTDARAQWVRLFGDNMILQP